VRITNYMEANGTAYLVMDYEEGESLDGFLRREQRRLEEPELLRVMIPILEGLCIVHRAGVLHRDVKPANIYLRAQGSPLLLDFGAARHALGEETQNLTSIVTPGYGPFELYQRTGKQGPWTDVYGAGATLYRLVTAAVRREADRAAAAPARIQSAGPGGRGRYTSACSRRSTGCCSRCLRTGPSARRPQRIASTDAPTLRSRPAHLERRRAAALATMEQGARRAGGGRRRSVSASDRFSWRARRAGDAARIAAPTRRRHPQIRAGSGHGSGAGAAEGTRRRRTAAPQPIGGRRLRGRAADRRGAGALEQAVASCG
jgi:hypothetical protein